MKDARDLFLAANPLRPPGAGPAVAVAGGLGPYENTRAALASIDLSPVRGRRVLLKPNVGRVAAPDSGVVTNPQVVAAAIEEHYLPRYAGDRLPETMPGVVVGLADRLDSLVGLFAVGIKPSGAADPWGLRRAALGLVQTLVGKGISLALPEALALAAEGLDVEVGEETLREVLEFVERRLRGYLLDAGYRFDAVDAVLAERSYDPALASETVAALGRWVERDDWAGLLDSYARCVRITRAETAVHAVDAERLEEPAAVALYAAYREEAPRVAEAGTVDALFEALVRLRPAITAFFDQVLVMAEDPAVRNNRLGLLQAIGALSEGIVDLTQMEGF